LLVSVGRVSGVLVVSEVTVTGKLELGGGEEDGRPGSGDVPGLGGGVG
jgi:hypothetical protein